MISLPAYVKNYGSETECVGDHCQKLERWVIASYVMSRRDWSLYLVHLQPPQFSFCVNGDFCRTPCVSSIYCWRSITGEPGGHPSLAGDEQDHSGLFSCSLLTQHAFYSRIPQEKQAHLPCLEIKPRENGDGGNNKPALFSRAEDWLFKNSLGISAESVPGRILDHFFLFLIFLDSSSF